MEKVGNKEKHPNICQLFCLRGKIEKVEGDEVSSLWDMIYVGFPLDGKYNYQVGIDYTFLKLSREF